MSHFMHHKFIAPNFSLGHFPFSPNIRKFWLEIKWNEPFRFGPTGIFGTAFEGGSLWPVHSFRSVQPKSPFHLTKLLCPVPLFCIPLAAGTINKHAVAWNGSVKPEWTFTLYWARGIFKISNQNFCWMESAAALGCLFQVAITWAF